MKTILDFKKMKQEGQKVSMLTCYDYTMARLFAQTEIDCVLVGDSLGMVVDGHPTTIPVSLEDMIYHTKSVKRGIGDLFTVSDLPFLSYHVSKSQAIDSAGQLLKAGAHAVKLEGGEYFAETVYSLTRCSIPVCAHLGMTPQSYNSLGGFKLQGKEGDDAERIMKDAKILQDAGAFAVVLELVPESLAKKIAETLELTVIGIGAGRYCDGQVLVINDVVGLDERFTPKMVKKYADLSSAVREAVSAYSSDVKEGKFPAKENVVKE